MLDSFRNLFLRAHHKNPTKFWDVWHSRTVFNSQMMTSVPFSWTISAQKWKPAVSELYQLLEIQLQPYFSRCCSSLRRRVCGPTELISGAFLTPESWVTYLKISQFFSMVVSVWSLQICKCPYFNWNCTLSKINASVEDIFLFPMYVFSTHACHCMSYNCEYRETPT